MVLKQSHFMVKIYSLYPWNLALVQILVSELFNITVLYFQSHTGGGKELKLGQSGWKISPWLKTDECLCGRSSDDLVLLLQRRRLWTEREEISMGVRDPGVWMTVQVKGPLTLQISSYIQTHRHIDTPTYFCFARISCTEINSCAALLKRNLTNTASIHMQIWEAINSHALDHRKSTE